MEGHGLAQFGMVLSFTWLVHGMVHGMVHGHGA